tara:strand:- start:1696 stop:2703 length:1008 start_codon:yes stop_codon:yes gene_type:complete
MSVNQNSRNLQFLNAEDETNKLVISQMTADFDDGQAITHETSFGCNPILFDLTVGSRVMINGNQLQLASAATAGQNSLSFNSTTLENPILIGDKIVIDRTNLFNQYQFKTEGTVAGFAVDTDGLTKGGIEITGWLDSDTMTGATANNVPTAESVKAYVDANSGGSVQNFKDVKCTSTITTSASDGEIHAVTIPFDTTITESNTNTITFYGSSGVSGLTGGANSWAMGTTGFYVFSWNVGTNTNISNNRILSGVKLQQGLGDGEAIEWTDIEPSYCYIYDRGNGSVRKGSTSGQRIIRHNVATKYYRLVLWKEESTTASTTAITLLNACNIYVQQI